MVTATRLATTYTATLNLAADRTQAALVALFDSLGTYDETTAWEFHGNARPVVEAAATAALEQTSAYLEAQGVTAALPELLVADAAARCFDPFDRLARNLANGKTWPDAIDGARSVAASLGDDAVFRTARDGMAWMAVDMRDWQRRLSTGCCQWCMKLSSVVFDSAGQATFGHAHCRCVPVPVDAIGDHNASVRDSAGFDAKAEALYDQRHAISRIKRSQRTAERNSADAAKQALTEPDPARRERLETRAQEWETRAEVAAERLRIIQTGTHRLAA